MQHVLSYTYLPFYYNLRAVCLIDHTSASPFFEAPRRHRSREKGCGTEPVPSRLCSYNTIHCLANLASRHCRRGPAGAGRPRQGRRPPSRRRRRRPACRVSCPLCRYDIMQPAETQYFRGGRASRKITMYGIMTAKRSLYRLMARPAPALRAESPAMPDTTKRSAFVVSWPQGGHDTRRCRLRRHALRFRAAARTAPHGIGSA